MKTKFIAALVLAASASIAAPAFASGYGPAPFYRPDVGAPSSQRGISAQTLAAEQGNNAAAQSDVGGSVSVAQSGHARVQADSPVNDTYFGR
ncbi:hypothetical protein B0G57_102409 [Trinickia symbiotica]|uniref:DUF4148 domain-containing protein n=1 Tax=Trinickia symbiotica TaxID=863227 RepID=A0A2N7XAI8_9BURK|nr:hypothetical protein [Trinickia symbiotica]PMS38776.1 hypothetical protein C0Z20_02740 [Trinickia symbiotica]PPK46814.1 hypothetical protein B0G57_102409 [Trinickia symbiotica]